MRPTKLTSEHVWVLKRLQNLGFRSALIAGGAVRDTYFKKFIMDIDIYLWDTKVSGEYFKDGKPNLKDKDFLVTLLDLPRNRDNVNVAYPVPHTSNRRKDDILAPPAASGSDSWFNNSITQITNVAKNYMKYQLIVVECNPLEFVEKKFAMDISRCYCDGVKMRYTNEFLNDAKNRTLTIDGDLKYVEYAHMMKSYVPKMKRKFPNHRVVDLLKDKLKK